jgi:hypothetical protein
LEPEYNSLAPLLLFIYNRPANTQKVLDSLAANPEASNSVLYIYCDGAKTGASNTMLQNIEQTRVIVKKETRFKEIKVIEQEVNKGLANSIIDGVTAVCNQHGSVIVLEDDIITSPFFLHYMNNALRIYKNTNQVGCISGYWYPIDSKLPDTFFLKTQSCWGWATWARAWNDFEPDGRKLLKQLIENKLTRQFDLDGSIQYTQMLKDQITGKNNSWAIRWDAVNFIKNKLCLYPGVSLVQNIGFDGVGTHAGKEKTYVVNTAIEPVDVQKIPLLECIEARNALISFYRNLNKANFYQRLGRIFSVRTWIKKLT